jgi:hypothetical protein
MSSYHLDRVLLVISMCKFCRGSGMISGRQGQCFLHHENAPSHTSLVVRQFLSSSNRHTLRISLRVALDCPLLWKWTSRGHVSQPRRASTWTRWLNSGRFWNEPSACASNSGKINEAYVHEQKVSTLHCHLPYHYSAIPLFREFFDCPSQQQHGTKSSFNFVFNQF